MRYYCIHTFLITILWVFCQPLYSQSIIVLDACDFTYIDPQDANNNITESRDTLIYTTSFEKDSLLRAFYVDINAFGGQQVDRTRVLAQMEDGSTKLLGQMAFGNCLSCVEGFAFMHNGVLQTQAEEDPSVMQLWLQSFNQPDFAIIGNLQTLNGVGRISGDIPFCAVGLRVEFVVNSNPNNATTEFSAHIICPREIGICTVKAEANIDCNNNEFTLNANFPVECFSDSVQVEWRNASGLISTNPAYQSSLTGNEGMYYLRVFDGCCLLEDSVFIANPDFANAGPDQSLCAGTALEINGTGGFGHYWESMEGTTFPDSTLLLDNTSPQEAGIYVLHAFNEEGCEDTDTLRIDIIVPPLPDVSYAEACIGDTLFLYVNNDTLYEQTEWYDPAGNRLANRWVPNIQGTDLGIYEIEATDSFGCTATQTLEVSGNEPPGFTSNIEESCDSSRIVLSPADYQYEWQNGTITNEFVTARGGDYQVTITDENGCSTIEILTLPEPDGPAVNLEVEQPLCPDDNGSILIVPEDPDQPMIFSIDGGATYSFDTYYDQLGPGQYNVVVQDGLECLQSFSVELIRPDTLWVAIEVDSNQLEVRPGTPVSLSATAVGSIAEIQWLPNEINTDVLTTSFIANQDMDIRIIVKDANDCFVSDALQLSVVLGNVFSPNAFSPNDDNNNEFFTLYSDLGSGEIIELLQVYDRYGNLMFSTREISLNQEELGWNGTHKGNPMPAGVYTYFGIVRFGNGVRKIYEGDVNLIR